MVRGDIVQELCLGQQGCSLKKSNIPRSNLTIISLFYKLYYIHNTSGFLRKLTS